MDLFENLSRVTRDKEQIDTLTEEQLLLLISTLIQGLILEENGEIKLTLDEKTKNFLKIFKNNANFKVRAYEQLKQSENLYESMITILDKLLLRFLLPDDTRISTEDSFLEVLFTFLDDVELSHIFTAPNVFLLIALLHYGVYLNEINAIGFYLNEEITTTIKELTPSSENFTSVLQSIKEFGKRNTDSLYDNVSGLVNYILENLIRERF